MYSQDTIVVVTRKTRLELLIERFNSWRQARFYLSHMQLDPGEYEAEHDVYRSSLAEVRSAVASAGRPVHTLERTLVPNYLLRPGDIVVTVGPDGLVANTAKYLTGQPLVAVNPDPTRVDGILAGYRPSDVAGVMPEVIGGRATVSDVTLAEAVLNDGQRLLAFNDFLVGCRGHVSARYRITWQGRSEVQSSSGVLVSTGVGSTGWLSSVRNMAAAIARQFGRDNIAIGDLAPGGWDDPNLTFVVREPFASKATGIELSVGRIEPGSDLVIESQTAEGGVIFSDGMEADALAFNAGAVVRIHAADVRAKLVRPSYYDGHDRLDGNHDRREAGPVVRAAERPRRDRLPA